MNVVDATTVFDAQLATRGQVARLIEAVGRPNFANTVMEVINQFLPVGRFAALFHEIKSGVHVVAAASRSSDMTSSTIAHAYARQYFQLGQSHSPTCRLDSFAILRAQPSTISPRVLRQTGHYRTAVADVWSG